ncbi:MAG: N-acetylglucosamine-6-phosphate deacetylase [Candidatus Omnitrophica bacterium]|nr:N-acetylglucosamine-6-phosphate deacetylase [bacterium]NUN95347.1 N-acetylglucosamine-6-phosphate deacetylase [Candidatus Omnitrophota bacterium]
MHESIGIPGWIDLQVNGHAGVSFSSAELTLEGVAEATLGLVEQGTHGFLATVITTPREVMSHCLSVLGEACEDPRLSKHLLGIHLEGPFLSAAPGAKGAHPAECMVPPSLALFQEFQRVAGGHIRLLTLAPELPGALELVAAIGSEVVCSAGHSLAGYRELRDAVKAGLRMGTHLGNGIPSQIPRHDNLVIGQMALPEITSSLITDGFHLPEGFIRACLAAKGSERLVVVSDQTHLAGLPPGEYSLGIAPVVLEANGFLHMRDEPYLAGSSRTQAECMSHLATIEGVTERDLYRMGYENPLKLLGETPLRG